MFLFPWFLCGLIAALGCSYMTAPGSRMRDLKTNFWIYLLVLASGPVNLVWALIYMLENDL